MKNYVDMLFSDVMNCLFPVESGVADRTVSGEDSVCQQRSRCNSFILQFFH